MKLANMLVLGFCAQGLSFAQTASRPVEFEVASVTRVAPLDPLKGAQPDRPRLTGAGVMSEAPDRITYRAVTLKRMLMKAYGLKPYQIVGPAWIESEHYDVIAKIPEGASAEEVPAMLQQVLTERFRITVHSEMKQQAVYVLGVGKGGAKLTPAAKDHPRIGAGFTVNNQTGLAEIRLMAETMDDFAGYLSNKLDRPVVDETGLPGKFDIKMAVDAQDLQPGADSLPSSLFTAMHGLGLQLEPGKVEVKHLVIDEAQKVPIEN